MENRRIVDYMQFSHSIAENFLQKKNRNNKIVEVIKYN